MGAFRLVFLAISKTFSKLFGLATITFFGRMPSKDDDQLGAVGVISTVWVALPVGIVFPQVAELLIPFLPDDDTIIRAVTIALTLVLPLVVGALLSTVGNRKNRDIPRWKTVLAGYVYTPIVGLLALSLLVVAPLTKASYLFRMFELRHLAIMVREGTYDDVREEVVEALGRNGIEVDESKPRWLLWQIFKGLVWLEEHVFCREMSHEMRLLRGEVDEGHLEITLHATDLSIIGPQRTVAKVQAILCEELSTDHVYFTWDDEAQQIEDEIHRLRTRIDGGDEVGYDEVLGLRDRLRDLELDPPEWNALRRHLYALERDVFRVQVEDLETVRQPP